MTENRLRAPAPGVYTPPQERSTHERSSGEGEEHPRSEEHFAPIDWEAGLRGAVEATLRARAARRAERAEFKRRRDWGLAQRHATKLARNRAEQEKTVTQCRYLRRNEAQCTAEAVDENEDLLLCSKHLARALNLLQRKGIHLANTKEN